MGTNVQILVDRMMSDRRHPEQGYRSAMGILSLGRGYGPARLDAACDRALAIEAITYASVLSILKSGLDQASPVTEPNPQRRATSQKPPDSQTRGIMIRWPVI